MPNRRVTSRDVGKLAGVSQSTVSLVLSAKADSRISDQTRQRVLAAARQLDYHPNAAARSLVRQQARAVGLILRENTARQTANTFSPLVIEGVSQALRANGFKLMLETVPEGTAPEKFFSAVHEGHVDGVILMAARPDDQELLQQYVVDVPVVLWGKLPGDLPYVDVDNTAAARLAVEHLIALGHRRIACIANAPPDHISAIDRVVGYRAALEAHHLPGDDNLIRYANFDEASGYEAMRSLLSGPARPTAVFVASDEVAIGALRAARGAGVQVPRDLALVAFDDLPMAERVTPALTTVRLPIRELGLVAAQMLIEYIESGRRPVSRFLHTELVVRESCGAHLAPGERNV